MLGQARPVPQGCEDLGWPGRGTGCGSPWTQLGWFLTAAAGCWPPASAGRSSKGPGPCRGRGAGAPGHGCVFSCFLGRHGKGNAGCPLRVGAGITHAHRTAPAGKVLVSHGEQMSHPQSCCRRSGIPHGGFHCSGGGRPSRALPHRSPLLLVSLSKTQPPAVIISLSVLQLMQRSNVPMREDCRGALSLLVAGGHGAKVTEST